MPTLRTESDTLLLSDPTRSRSTVHIGIAHPTPLEEAAFGKLHLIVEIESTERINHDIISALQEELRTVYYRSTEFTLENAFEVALHRGNERLHRFITEGITQWTDHFNAIVAVVKNDLLTFSSIGRIHSFLFRGNRITDIIGKGGLVEERRNPLKLFSTILSGHLQPNDRILLCTSSLLDYFSQEKLKRLIIDDLPSATVSNIEKSLLTNSATASFGAIFFAFLPQENVTSDQPIVMQDSLRQASVPERSMEELISKERTTEQLLSPSVMPNIKAFISESATAVGSFVRTMILRQPPRRRVPRGAAELPTTMRPVTTKNKFSRSIKQAVVRLLIALLSLPRAIANVFRYQKKVVSNVRAIPTKTTERTNRIVRWVQTMTAGQRIIAILAIVALFVLSQGIVSLTTNRAHVVRGDEAANVAATIEDNISKASAALTYGDYDGAKKLLDESGTLLSTLANKSKKEKEAVSSLQQKIDAVRVQTRRIATPSITAVANLASTLQNALPTSLAIVGSNAIVTTNKPNLLITASISKGTVTTNADDTNRLAFAVPLDTQTAVLGTSESTLQTFSLTTKRITNADVTFENADRSIVAAAVFQSRLYLLDTKNQSILRALRTSAGFSPATQWLKQRYPDLTDATSIAVDGSIYVALANGDIQRFTAGIKDDSALELVEPALHTLTKIWTTSGSTTLYILEPSEKRLLLYTKSSKKLKVQYVDDRLGDAISFAIDEKSKVAYVVLKNSIIKFTVAP
ncbi:MAG: hypothetical protein V1907_02255 [Candidatus Kerfeldbacteria bacterium]